MRILTAADIEGLLPAATLVSAIEDALHATLTHEVSVPLRSHVQCSGGTLLLMPAIDTRAIGVKLISVIPGNSARQMPVTSGTMMLLDAATGETTALLDGTTLTAHRTGAIGATALKWMTPPDLSSLGVVGIGAQGTCLAIAACGIRPLRQICYLARSTASESRFRQRFLASVKDVELIACTRGSDLLKRVRTIITATTSSQPVLPDDPALLEGRQVFAFGSFTPAMQEVPSALARLAGNIVVDADAARAESGDVINPLKQGALQPGDIMHLGEIVSGRKKLRNAATTLFKSVGMAAYDLFVARLILQEANSRNAGVRVNLANGS
jgi:ornithine cyclodeaminase/alanine dehydrogenase-like protein (mu-crystallin family)